MIALDNGKLTRPFGAPIVAGSIFTEAFNPDKIDPSNLQAAIEFGRLCSGRPATLRFKCQYVPGEQNKDKSRKYLLT